MNNYAVQWSFIGHMCKPTRYKTIQEYTRWLFSSIKIVVYALKPDFSVGIFSPKLPDTGKIVCLFLRRLIILPLTFSAMIDGKQGERGHDILPRPPSFVSKHRCCIYVVCIALLMCHSLLYINWIRQSLIFAMLELVKSSGASFEWRDWVQTDYMSG